jgi:hypothetical protein
MSKYNRIFFFSVSPPFNLNSRDKNQKLWVSVKLLGKENGLGLTPPVTCNVTEI